MQNFFNNNYHKSVLVSEVLEYLNIKPGAIYIDATFGGGGHTQAILEAEPTCKVIAIDWDIKALEINAPAIKEKFGDRFDIIWGNFSQIKYLLKKENICQVDGILADFGTSQFQIHNKAGFSFSGDTELDMRMSNSHQHITAKIILNNASEKELITIFRDYGQEDQARSIAKKIVLQRSIKPFDTTSDLVKLIETIKFAKPGSIHPATKVFQALRIVVNKELENINSFLINSVPFLAPAGRLVCISFHSLEDSLVKQFFKDKKYKLKNLTNKVITASPEELF